MDATASSPFGDLMRERTGVGIAKEDPARVFEEFYQIHGEGRSVASTACLELSRARRPLALLGGDLTLEATVDPDNTSTVTVPPRIGVG
jgi:signal transduction histidine kinase